MMPRAVAAPFSRPLSKSNEKSNACLQYVCKSVKLFTLTALKLWSELLINVRKAAILSKLLFVPQLITKVQKHLQYVGNMYDILFNWLLINYWQT